MVAMQQLEERRNADVEAHRAAEAVAPSELNATPRGSLPTVMVSITVLVATSITDTVSSDALVT